MTQPSADYEWHEEHSGLPPHAVHELFETLFNQGDLDRLMELYESSGALVDREGQTLSGPASIAAFLNDFISAHQTIRLSHWRTIDAGDVCVVLSRWELHQGDALKGKAFVDSGTTYDVVRRQSDGSWKIAVASPWGSAWAGQ